MIFNNDEYIIDYNLMFSFTRFNESCFKYTIEKF